MKTAYNIDEFNISNFCINSLKAYNKDSNKFILFKHLLHTFHDIEEIYEGSFEEYAAFIMHSVIKAAVINNKNILSYEQYVFDVLSGFYFQKYNKNIDTKKIAKVWTNIVFIFEVLLKQSSNPSYKNIEFYKPIFTSLKHINTKVNNNSYSLTAPLIFEKESGYDVFLILPKIKNTYFNIVIPFLVKYFKNRLHNLFIVEISTETLDYSINTLEINNNVLNQYSKYFDTLYIDFNKVNFQNCSLCPLSCNKRELLNIRFEVTPFNPNKKILKVINI